MMFNSGLKVRGLPKDEKFVPFWQTLNEMNLFIISYTVQAYLKFKLSFSYKYKKYFKKVHGQHEKWRNC